MTPTSPSPCFDRIASFLPLVAAAGRAKRGKRLSEDARAFFVNLESEVLALERELVAGAWRPGPYRTFIIREPKPRTISAAPFRDRVVHHAFCGEFVPLLESLSSPASHACRKGRGPDTAVNEARAAIVAQPEFVKLDIHHYFETIDRDLLSGQLDSVIYDARVRALAAAILGAETPGSPRGIGLPIGNLTSQHFANFYLNGLDHAIGLSFPDVTYVRFMDDMLFLGPTRRRLREVEQLASQAIEALRMTVKHTVTRRGPVSAGVPFLGLRLWPDHVRFDRARRKRLLAKLREVDRLGSDESAQPRAESLMAWASRGHALALVSASRARAPPSR